MSQVLGITLGLKIIVTQSQVLDLLLVLRLTLMSSENELALTCLLSHRSTRLV